MRLRLSERPYIIAEAGTCHASPRPEDRLPKAMEYVRAAASAGADAVKFQVFATPIRDMFCWHDGDEQHEAHWNNSALTPFVWCTVAEEASLLRIDFLASCFQYRTVEWLKIWGCKASKVASRAANWFPYERAPTPWLISTGEGMPAAHIASDPRAILLECESRYPSTARYEGRHPGFSDHSGTPERAIDAIKRGARLIEVHFYISPEDAGPDRESSLTLDQLKEVCACR